MGNREGSQDGDQGLGRTESWWELGKEGGGRRRGSVAVCQGGGSSMAGFSGLEGLLLIDRRIVFLPPLVHTYNNLPPPSFTAILAEDADPGDERCHCCFHQAMPLRGMDFTAQVGTFGGNRFNPSRTFLSMGCEDIELTFVLLVISIWTLDTSHRLAPYQPRS